MKIKKGYTIIELLVTVLIVTILATTVGALFVKLLTIQEHERDEAYLQEKLIAVCGNYADYISVGNGINTITNWQRQGVVETLTSFPQETGGVSVEPGGYYETGKVIRVVCMTTTVDQVIKTLNLNICSLDVNGNLTNRYSRMVRGDALLLPLTNDFVNCSITVLKTNGWNCSALGLLTISAEYKGEDDLGNVLTKTTKVERVVRLWNTK